jgi:hypothetical protein
LTGNSPLAANLPGKDIVDMESLLVNTIIGIWLVAFGAMALFPLLIDIRSTSTRQEAPVDDQIISIQPVAFRHQVTPIEQPLAADAPEAPGRTHPIRQHAA